MTNNLVWILSLGALGVALLASAAIIKIKYADFKVENIIVNASAIIISASVALYTYHSQISEAKKDSDEKDVLAIKSSLSGYLFASRARAKRLDEAAQRLEFQTKICSTPQQYKQYIISDLEFISRVISVSDIAGLDPRINISDSQIREINAKFGDLIPILISSTQVEVGAIRNMLDVAKTASLNLFFEVDTDKRHNRMCQMENYAKYSALLLMLANARGTNQICAIGSVFGNIEEEEKLRKTFIKHQDEKYDLVQNVLDNEDLFKGLNFFGSNCYDIVDVNKIKEMHEVMEKSISLRLVPEYNANKK